MRVRVPVGVRGSELRSAEVSMRCDDCDRIRYTTRTEVQRASRLRCLHCGGLLHESQAQERRDHRLSVSRFGGQPLLGSPCDDKPHACVCGARFRSAAALKLHREESHGETPARPADPENRCRLCNRFCELLHALPSGTPVCGECLGW